MTWQTKLVSVLLVLASLFAWHKYEVNSAVSKSLAEQSMIHQKNIDELVIKSLKVESGLKTQVASIVGDKDAKLKDLDRKYRNAIDSLRQRPERSSQGDITGNSCNAESPKGATGTELYREDAAFLIWFARDTEELKANLNACYLQYDTVKQKLDKFKQ